MNEFYFVFKCGIRTPLKNLLTRAELEEYLRLYGGYLYGGRIKTITAFINNALPGDFIQEADYEIIKLRQRSRMPNWLRFNL